jgi:UDP-N-acetylglucosamine/UDP-N-acetylgalactosamine diphosphorylase
MQSNLLARLTQFGQQHLLRFWGELAEVQRQRLADQIAAIDFAQLDRLFHGREEPTDWRQLAPRAEPPPAFQPSHSDASSPTVLEAHGEGVNALAADQVGAILVAGGQATRLGVSSPKGMFPIGPVSGASLFQILAEKVVAVSRRFRCRVPLYLMTSPATHAATLDFLARHGNFGVPAADLTVFCQGTMPAVDAESGRVLLAERGDIALSPDGHGGMLAALGRSGALDDIRRRKLTQLFYFQVDNPLVGVCDPVLIGYHRLAGSELSTQVVAKRSADDRLGCVVRIDGQVRIVEYSDLPAEAAAATQADGSLRLWAGNTAVHVFDADFLHRVADNPGLLPLHVARKRVPYVDANGQLIEPSEPNAIKFERFIFDLLPQARSAIVVEVDREETFAPVKYADGKGPDTPEHVKAQITRVYTRWLQRAGVQVDAGVPVEISPLFALDEEELRDRIRPGTVIHDPLYLR